MKNLFDNGPVPIPDCSNVRCGEKQGGNFGIGPAGLQTYADQQANTHFFCYACWLLQPTTQAHYQQQVREAMELD